MWKAMANGWHSLLSHIALLLQYQAILVQCQSKMRWKLKFLTGFSMQRHDTKGAVSIKNTLLIACNCTFLPQLLHYKFLSDRLVLFSGFFLLSHGTANSIANTVRMLFKSVLLSGASNAQHFKSLILMSEISVTLIWSLFLWRHCRNSALTIELVSAVLISRNNGRYIK